MHFLTDWASRQFSAVPLVSGSQLILCRCFIHKQASATGFFFFTETLWNLTFRYKYLEKLAAEEYEKELKSRSVSRGRSELSLNLRSPSAPSSPVPNCVSPASTESQEELKTPSIPCGTPQPSEGKLKGGQGEQCWVYHSFSWDSDNFWCMCARILSVRCQSKGSYIAPSCLPKLPTFLHWFGYHVIFSIIGYTNYCYDLYYHCLLLFKWNN